MKGNRRILAVLLALALLISLCACASTQKEPPVSVPSSQDDPGVEISPSEEETPVAAPETLPEDTTELTVPLQMVLPGADIFQGGEWSYSSQGDEDVCRQWLYNLKAEDITALYGEVSPLDHYWTGEMSMEDSRQIVDLLRSVAPDLAPLESGNPYTGGGWTIALYTKDEAVDFGFNGGWFTFTYQGTIWIFDAENAPVQENCNDIGGILSSYGSKAQSPADSIEVPVTEPPATESPVTETNNNGQTIYALDSKNYVAAEVKDSKAVREALQNRAVSDGKASGYGYLIVTPEGKEYVYLNDSDEDQTLNKYCQAALNNGPLHPSWLIHMEPERLIRVDAMKGDGGLITDQETMLAVAKRLKEEVTVQPEAAVYDGADEIDMSEEQYFWRLTFDSRVYYNLIGYARRNYLSLYASDLDKYIVYRMDDGVIDKLIDLGGREELH